MGSIILVRSMFQSTAVLAKSSRSITGSRRRGSLELLVMSGWEARALKGAEGLKSSARSKQEAVEDDAITKPGSNGVLI